MQWTLLPQVLPGGFFPQSQQWFTLREIFRRNSVQISGVFSLCCFFFFFSSPALCPAKSGYLDFSASCLFQFNSTNLLGFTWIPNVCTLAGNSFDEVSQNNHTDSLICFLVSMITALCCLMYSISQTIVLIYFVQF